VPAEWVVSAEPRVLISDGSASASGEHEYAPLLLIRLGGINLEVKGGRAMTNEETDNIVYKVVVNHEEQYSIWPKDKDNPLGWSNVNKSGTKAECLDYIKEVWTDMRPLSLRNKMEQVTQ